MKIAQVICTFPPYRGGMGNSAYRFARLLKERGHEAAVFTPAYRPLTAAEKSEETVPVERLRPLFKSGNAAVLPQLFGRLKGYDVVMLHYPFYGSMLPVLLAKLERPRTKLLLYYHMDGLAPGLKGIVFRLTAKFLLPLLLKSADQVFCSTRDYAEHSGLARYQALWQDKFSELPFGFEQEAFLAPARPERHRPFGLLFVGGLDQAHYFKGLAVLFEALAGIDPAPDNAFQLTIVGSGDLAESYRRQARDLGLEERVRFAGNLSDQELAAAYRQCDALVLPSTTQGEAFGIVLVEAMAAGKPVIASNLPGVRSVFVDGQQGLLAEPGNAADLSGKILSLMQDEPLRQRLGAAARDLAWRKYSWAAIGERLETLLARLDKK